MSKISKKIIGVILSAVMLFSVPMTTYAASQTNDNIEESIMELEKYLSLTDEGTIFFNTNEALKDGFSEETVMAVEKNIVYMNELALKGVAQIDDSFTATIYFLSTRAVGESKIVTHWYGTTEIYLNSDEASDFLRTVKNHGNVISDFSGFLEVLSICVPNYYTQVASLAGSFGVLLNSVQISQITNAVKPGTGIIIYVTNLPADNFSSITVFPQ